MNLCGAELGCLKEPFGIFLQGVQATAISRSAYTFEADAYPNCKWLAQPYVHAFVLGDPRLVVAALGSLDDGTCTSNAYVKVSA